MKKSSRIMSALLAAAMLVVSAAGCSNSGTETSSASSDTATSSSAAEGESSAAEEGGPEAAPLSGKITVEVFDRGNTGGSDPTNNHWTQWIQEKFTGETGVEVEFVSVPRSEEVPRLNVLMASNSAPDISYTYTASVVYNFYKNGGLADLSSSLENYGQELMAYLGDELLTYGQFDGVQVAIPAKRISRAKYATYIRKDWLDKLGMEMPTTKEEFHEALTAFKEQDPGGVGENLIPYEAWSDVTWCFGQIMDSFIDYSADDKELSINYVSGIPITMPGYKDGMKWINQLYNEGLIDPQFPLYKDNVTPDANASAGFVGAYSHNYDYPLRTSPGIITELTAAIPDAEFVPVDCFENPHMDNKTVKQLYDPAGLLIFVPATSQNVDGAIAYLNWLSDYDQRFYITCGEEGTNHTLDENGIPVMVNVEGEMIMNSANNLDYAVILNGVDLDDETKNLEVLSKSYEPGLEDIFMEAYEVSTANGLTVPRIATPTNAEAQYGSNLAEKAKEVIANAIVAPVDQFDAIYDAGIQEYLTAGAQQCIDERSAAWDAENP